jgi:hypothetical protein
MEEPRTPDSKVVIEKLEALKKEAEALQRKAQVSAEFDIWLSEVSRWLKAGGLYTRDQWGSFESLRFTPVSDYDPDPPYEVWKKAFKIARHLMSAAIENLSNGWGLPKAPEQSTNRSPSANSVVINNTNVQLNSLTVLALLSRIADEIDKVEATEGKNFKDRLRRWAGNPIFKTVLEATIGAVLRS